MRRLRRFQQGVMRQEAEEQNPNLDDLPPSETGGEPASRDGRPEVQH